MRNHTSDLIEHLRKTEGLTKAAATRQVHSVIKAITELTADPEVPLTLRGFGTFERKTRAARTALNPQTGEQIHVPAKATLRFRASKQ